MPRTTLEIVGGEQRLRKIAALSRVELDGNEPIAPRFNMPFEAGLAVMHSLGGTDVYGHGGTASGVLSEISNALIGAKRRPTFDQMFAVLDQARNALPKIVDNSKAKTPYTARVFSDLVVVANGIVNQQLPRQGAQIS